MDTKEQYAKYTALGEQLKHIACGKGYREQFGKSPGWPYAKWYVIWLPREEYWYLLRITHVEDDCPRGLCEMARAAYGEYEKLMEVAEILNEAEYRRNPPPGYYKVMVPIFAETDK